MTDLGISGGWLTVNRFCNFRCKWCYAMGTTFKSEDNMPFEMAKNLIDLMHQIGVHNVILIGGETLFWPHLFPVASYLKSLGMTSAVVTNGWLLGFEKFRNRVKKSDITSLNISLKGGNRQQYIDLTRFDGFETTIEGLREVNKWQHIDTGISTVISTETLSNLDEITRVAFSNGAKFINFSTCGPMVNRGSFDSQYVPEPVDVVNAFVAEYETINTLTDGRFSIEGTLPTCLWPPDLLRTLEERGQISYGCHFKTRSGVLFDRWGSIIPCNHLYDYPLGTFGVDFTDLESFKSVWNHPQINAFYGKMLAYPTTRCVTCCSFDKCGGGCPLNWFIREPDSVIPIGEIS